MKIGEDKVILGENVAYSTDSNKTGVNNNILICAGSGSGKTMSIMEPRLLNTFNSSLVVTVTKRRIVEKYKPLFVERGYFVRDLNFINPSKSNVAYDPLKYIDGFSDYSGITFLAKSIVMSNPKRETCTNTDPFWDDAAVSLLSAEISYVLMTKRNATFADVLNLHSTLTIKESGNRITTSLDASFKTLAERYPKSFAINCWQSFNILPMKTASCVYGTLNSIIDTIFSPELKDMIAEKENVNFENLATRKTILFITTSAVNPSLNCFINMFYAQMFKQLFEYAESLPTGKLPIPVSVLCDDFATGSKVLNFSEYISVFREKLISVMLLIQSESQLESIYGINDAVTIINNCDTYIFMGGMDLSTAKNMSIRTNMPIEDILYMPIGDEIIFRRGQRPIFTKRYNVLNDAEYQRVTQLYEDSINRKLDKNQFDDNSTYSKPVFVPNAEPDLNRYEEPINVNTNPFFGMWGKS